MTGESAGNVRFHEEQRFRQRWLWWTVAIGEVTSLAIASYALFVLAPPAANGDGGFRVLVLAGAASISGVTFLLLASACLTTEVRDDGLFVRYFPFHFSFRQIPLDSAVGVEAVTYRPLLEYGGWGIRWTVGGKAYNVSGNRGARVLFADGRHLLIGSNRPQELAAAIEAVRNPAGPGGPSV